MLPVATFDIMEVHIPEQSEKELPEHWKLVS
jgi:hypothetical protein